MSIVEGFEHENMSTSDLITEVTQLKASNESLKQEIKELKDIVKTIAEATRDLAYVTQVDIWDDRQHTHAINIISDSIKKLSS